MSRFTLILLIVLASPHALAGEAVDQARAQLQSAEAAVSRARAEAARSAERAQNAIDSTARHEGRLADLRAEEQALTRPPRPSQAEALARVRSAIRQIEFNVQEAEEHETRTAAEARLKESTLEESRTMLAAAQEQLATAISQQIEVREALGESAAELRPPYLKEVRVRRGTNTLYFGRWWPKADELGERIESEQAILASLPGKLAARKHDLQVAIDKTRTAIEATETAMAAYLETVDEDLDARISTDIASSTLAIGQDALLGGGHVGAAIAAIEELYKIGRPGGTYDQIDDYWDISRLPTSSLGEGRRRDATDALNEVGAIREAVQHAERVRSGEAADTSSIASGVSEATTASSSLIDALADTLLSDMRKLVANEGTNRLADYLNEKITGQVADEANLKVKILQLVGGLAIDAVTTAGKEGIREAATQARLEAYRAYLAAWAYQVLMESEAIRASRDYWMLRQARLKSLTEIDRLTARREASPDSEQALKVTSLDLDENRTYRLTLKFSKAVRVTSVSVDGRRISVTGSGAEWHGSLDTSGMAGRVNLVVDARDREGYRLHNPHKLPEWSTELGRYDYQARADHYHHFAIRSAQARDGQAEAGRTGITVGVADVFGESGLRVQPAPGVKILVLDAEGRTHALSTMEHSFNSAFIELTPGRYRLRLDIGNYEPALPAHCTDGYVRDFEITNGKHLTFAASVYSVRAAEAGGSISTGSGDCITLKE